MNPKQTPRRFYEIGKIVPGELSKPVSAYCRHTNSLYQPILECKVDMIKAMADVYRWSRRHRISIDAKKVFLLGIRNYILNGIITAREVSRTDIALRIIATSIKWGSPILIIDNRIFRQFLALSKEFAFNICSAGISH